MRVQRQRDQGEGHQSRWKIFRNRARRLGAVKLEAHTRDPGTDGKDIDRDHAEVRNPRRRLLPLGLITITAAG
jgi:hypothetical protein